MAKLPSCYNTFGLDTRIIRWGRVFKKTTFHQMRGAQGELLKLSLRALWLKDRPTYHHALNVARLAVALALDMRFGGKDLTLVWTGALLHDIGKLYMTDMLLGSKHELTLQESDQLQEHAVIGFELFKVTPMPKLVLEIIRHHHERWDGLGYPDRLQGRAIPLPVRLVAVCDAFEAMTQGRAYQVARDEALALQELKDNATHQFCPETVARFAEIHARGDLYRFRDLMPAP